MEELVKEVSPFRRFSREEWSALRADTPMTLTQADLDELRGLNDRIDLHEVETIYLPLSRLLNLYVAATQGLFRATNNFLHLSERKVPYVIGMAGSVAVGKSTTRKGFPESYDLPAILRFLSDIKAGKRNVTAPLYSHLTYDVLKDDRVVVDQPDILIVEGLNVLQTGRPPRDGRGIPNTSDFFDFSIYIDADVSDLHTWYIERFLALRAGAFRNPKSYFNRYSTLTDGEARETATRIWDTINLVNLRENVLPTRPRADLVLRKGADHFIRSVFLRKL